MRILGPIISVIGTFLLIGSILQLVSGKIDFSNSDKFTGWLGATGISVLMVVMGVKMAHAERGMAGWPRLPLWATWGHLAQEVQGKAALDGEPPLAAPPR